MEPTPTTVAPVTPPSSLTEPQESSAPEQEQTGTAFGMSVTKEADVENTSARQSPVHALTDHDYCRQKVQQELDALKAELTRTITDNPDTPWGDTLTATNSFLRLSLTGNDNQPCTITLVGPDEDLSTVQEQETEDDRQRPPSNVPVEFQQRQQIENKMAELKKLLNLSGPNADLGEHSSKKAILTMAINTVKALKASEPSLGEASSETDPTNEPDADRPPLSKRRRMDLHLVIPSRTPTSPSSDVDVTSPLFGKKDESLSSSLDSYPEESSNPFDLAFAEAQPDEGQMPETAGCSRAELESRYGPITRTPEQKERETALFRSTNRM